MVTINTPETGHDLGRFAKPGEVMLLLGYKDRSAFWGFVHRHGVPNIRLNQRRIIFPRSALEAWLQARAIGGNTR